MIRAWLTALCVLLTTIVVGFAFRDLLPSTRLFSAVRVVLEVLAGALIAGLALVELLALRRQDLVSVVAALSGLATIVLGGVLLLEISESSLPLSQALLESPRWLRWGTLAAALMLLVAAGTQVAAALSERRMRDRTGGWLR